MKKIYTHENRMIVFNIKNLLASDGIETLVVNEFASGGVGDLATLDTWPELWLEDDSKLQRALKIIAAVETSETGADWFCRGCQEVNAATFQLCWNCGRPDE